MGQLYISAVPRTDEIRRRVDRLLAGEKNTRDLDSLFVWLRTRSFGNKAVADLGDFVAHSDERDKGITHRGVQRFFDQADFKMPFPDGVVRPSVTVAQLTASVWGAFESYGPQRIKSKFHLGQSNARKELTIALATVTAADGKKISISRPLTPIQAHLLQHFSSLIVPQVAFDEKELSSQLMTSLAKNHLTDGYRDAPQEMREFVSLYVIEKMHFTNIVLSDGRRIHLEAGITELEGSDRLSVRAVGPVGPFNLALIIYLTTLDPREHCDAVLLPGERLESCWNFPLEIGPTGKLQRL